VEARHTPLATTRVRLLVERIHRSSRAFPMAYRCRGMQPVHTPEDSMPKAKRKQHQRYTDEKRASILAAADKDKLTAKQVQAKFGVTPVTFYSWRKKKAGGARRGRPAGPKPNGGLAQQLRVAARANIEALMPSILRSEIDAVIKSN